MTNRKIITAHDYSTILQVGLLHSRFLLLQCVKTIVTVSLFFASVAFANDASLSNAEAAALAHRAAVRAEQSVKFCEHTLIYGSDEAKTHLLSVLDGRSCGEAAGNSTDQESSP